MTNPCIQAGTDKVKPFTLYSSTYTLNVNRDHLLHCQAISKINIDMNSQLLLKKQGERKRSETLNISSQSPTKSITILLQSKALLPLAFKAQYR
jgi:hypothetical protein